jgi:hypothetical protein
LTLGAESLGNKLADIALTYDVGIEIDFEDDSALKNSTVLTQVVEMAAAFRVRAGPEVVFTINVGAASGAPGYHKYRYFCSLCPYPQLYSLRFLKIFSRIGRYFLSTLFSRVQNLTYFSWINAMVDDDLGNLSFENGYKNYWKSFENKGESNIVLSLWAKTGLYQACSETSITRDMVMIQISVLRFLLFKPIAPIHLIAQAAEWALSRGFSGMMFWQVGLDSPTDCPGLAAVRSLFAGGNTAIVDIPTSGLPFFVFIAAGIGGGVFLFGEQ